MSSTPLVAPLRRPTARVVELISKVFGLPPTRRMNFRWAQLEADARALRDGRQVHQRLPLRNIYAPVLDAWREVLPGIDERMRRFVRFTRDNIGFRWEECEDLSRHVWVWGDGQEHSFSFEPRRDGLVDLIASTVHSSKPFMSAGPKSSLCFTEQPAALIQEQLDWVIRRWARALPRRVWWDAMGFGARDVVAGYGFATRAGLAAVDVMCCFEAEARADLPPAVAPFAEDEDHVRFAALMKIATEFGRTLPENAPLRHALEELHAAMDELAKDERAWIVDVYRSPLV